MKSKIKTLGKDFWKLELDVLGYTAYPTENRDFMYLSRHYSKPEEAINALYIDMKKGKKNSFRQ